MRFLAWLECKVKDHDDHIDRVLVTETRFISFGQCQRCKRQWWMWGEVGAMRGVRIIKSKNNGH